MDPGRVPAELQGLSEVEELLISRAFPIMSIFTVNTGVNTDTKDTYSIFNLKLWARFFHHKNRTIHNYVNF